MNAALAAPPTGSKRPGPQSKAPKKSSRVKQQPTPDHTYDSAPVRHFRDATRNCWVVANEQRTGFVAWFSTGLMTSPTLTGTAPRMSCGSLVSTGEAVGKLITRDEMPGLHMPGDAQYCAPLAFLPEKGVFVIKGTEFPVASCDYLLMNANGSSQFGWKERPTGAPDITEAAA